MLTRSIFRLSMALAAASLSLGCAGSFGPASPVAYFTVVESGDAWSPKIGDWQERARAGSPWAPEGAPEEVLALAEPIIIPFALSDTAVPDDVGRFSPFANTGVAALAPRKPVSALWPRPTLSQDPMREAQAAADPEAEPFDDGDLRGKYAHFRAVQRRQMVREFVGWIQQQSRSHYVSDGAVDEWSTLEETLRQDGDDCDGLELLVYHGLRDLGFRETEVFRSIIYRSSDLQHHMVTLWFEDPNDPWVIDPTGVMSETMVRMSERPDWVPLKLFTETREYTARRQLPSRSGFSLLAANP